MSKEIFHCTAGLQSKQQTSKKNIRNSKLENICDSPFYMSKVDNLN